MDRQRVDFASRHCDADRVVAGIEFGAYVSPVRVRTAAIVETTTSWLLGGRPRWFIVMCEKSRCSILFHAGAQQVVRSDFVVDRRAATSDRRAHRD